MRRQKAGRSSPADAPAPRGTAYQRPRAAGGGGATGGKAAHRAQKKPVLPESEQALFDYACHIVWQDPSSKAVPPGNVVRGDRTITQLLAYKAANPRQVFIERPPKRLQSAGNCELIVVGSSVLEVASSARAMAEDCDIPLDAARTHYTATLRRPQSTKEARARDKDAVKRLVAYIPRAQAVGQQIRGQSGDVSPTVVLGNVSTREAGQAMTRAGLSATQQDIIKLFLPAWDSVEGVPGVSPDAARGALQWVAGASSQQPFGAGFQPRRWMERFHPGCDQWQVQVQADSAVALMVMVHALAATVAADMGRLLERDITGASDPSGRHLATTTFASISGKTSTTTRLAMAWNMPAAGLQLLPVTAAKLTPRGSALQLSAHGRHAELEWVSDEVADELSIVEAYERLFAPAGSSSHDWRLPGEPNFSMLRVTASTCLPLTEFLSSVAGPMAELLTAAPGAAPGAEAVTLTDQWAPTPASGDHAARAAHLLAAKASFGRSVLQSVYFDQKQSEQRCVEFLEQLERQVSQTTSLGSMAAVKPNRLKLGQRVRQSQWAQLPRAVEAPKQAPAAAPAAAKPAASPADTRRRVPLRRVFGHTTFKSQQQEAAALKPLHVRKKMPANAWGWHVTKLGRDMCISAFWEEAAYTGSREQHDALHLDTAAGHRLETGPAVGVTVEVTLPSTPRLKLRTKLLQLLPKGKARCTIMIAGANGPNRWFVRVAAGFDQGNAASERHAREVLDSAIATWSARKVLVSAHPAPRAAAAVAAAAAGGAATPADTAARRGAPTLPAVTGVDRTLTPVREVLVLWDADRCPVRLPGLPEAGPQHYFEALTSVLEEAGVAQIDASPPTAVEGLFVQSGNSVGDQFLDHLERLELRTELTSRRRGTATAQILKLANRLKAKVARYGWSAEEARGMVACVVASDDQTLVAPLKALRRTGVQVVALCSALGGRTQNRSVLRLGYNKVYNWDQVVARAIAMSPAAAQLAQAPVPMPAPAQAPVPAPASVSSRASGTATPLRAAKAQAKEGSGSKASSTQVRAPSRSLRLPVGVAHGLYAAAKLRAPLEKRRDSFSFLTKTVQVRKDGAKKSLLVFSGFPSATATEEEVDEGLRSWADMARERLTELVYMRFEGVRPDITAELRKRFRAVVSRVERSSLLLIGPPDTVQACCQHVESRYRLSPTLVYGPDEGVGLEMPHAADRAAQLVAARRERSQAAAAAGAGADESGKGEEEVQAGDMAASAPEGGEDVAGSAADQQDHDDVAAVDEEGDDDVAAVDGGDDVAAVDGDEDDVAAVDGDDDVAAVDGGDVVAAVDGDEDDDVAAVDGGDDVAAVDGDEDDDVTAVDGDEDDDVAAVDGDDDVAAVDGDDDVAAVDDEGDDDVAAVDEGDDDVAAVAAADEEEDDDVAAVDGDDDVAAVDEDDDDVAAVDEEEDDDVAAVDDDEDDIAAVDADNDNDSLVSL